jgi:hypothetical protein
VSGRCRRAMAGLVGLALLAGCSNNTESTAGTLDVRLASPNTDDGAVLLTISGGPVDSVEAAGYTLYSAAAGASTRFIATGNVGSGTIARIHVPDVRLASRYVASIDQAAARLTYAQRDLAHYRVTLVP